MINLLPTPKMYRVIDEDYHLISNTICTKNKSWQSHIDAFKTNFKNIFDIELSDGCGGIELIEDPSLACNAYSVNTEGSLKVYASSSEGLCYGLASVLQLVSAENGEIQVQSFTVEDAPDKDYRAFMVDLGRIWHPFNTLLHFVDICFLYKIKYLHLHFIDSNVYSLPSKVLPKLPTEGAHYSFDEIERLNEYAKSRGVVIIPEYECPGHAFRFNQKYPEIFSDEISEEAESDYYNENGQKIDNKEIVCAGSENAWEYTKALLKEICDMFPDSPYINIGGDEANITVWNECPVCRKYMKENGIADERELYSEYVARVTSYILTLGKTPMVWEGFPKAGCEKIPKETIVFAWESHYHLAPDLLDAGFRIINASWQPLYIVPSLIERWNPFDIMKWNVYNWQHWWPNSAACLNPINVAPTDKVLGSMMCSWEQCYEQEIQHVMENLSAMSERVWNVERLCDDNEFASKHRRLMMLAAHAIRER